MHFVNFRPAQLGDFEKGDVVDIKDIVEDPAADPRSKSEHAVPTPPTRPLVPFINSARAFARPGFQVLYLENRWSRTGRADEGKNFPGCRTLAKILNRGSSALAESVLRDKNHIQKKQDILSQNSNPNPQDQVKDDPAQETNLFKSFALGRRPELCKEYIPVDCFKRLEIEERLSAGQTVDGFEGNSFSVRIEDKTHLGRNPPGGVVLASTSKTLHIPSNKGLELRLTGTNFDVVIKLRPQKVRPEEIHGRLPQIRLEMNLDKCAEMLSDASVNCSSQDFGTRQALSTRRKIQKRGKKVCTRKSNTPKDRKTQAKKPASATMRNGRRGRKAAEADKDKADFDLEDGNRMAVEEQSVEDLQADISLPRSASDQESDSSSIGSGPESLGGNSYFKSPFKYIEQTVRKGMKRLNSAQFSRQNVQKVIKGLSPDKTPPAPLPNSQETLDFWVQCLERPYADLLPSPTPSQGFPEDEDFWSLDPPTPSNPNAHRSLNLPLNPLN